MKIGDFSKKYKIPIDTIRYYIEQQLLLTQKKGTQYSFTQEDNQDMEEILELKRLGFSINEIQNVLSYKRLASNRTTEYRNHLRDFLEDKKKQAQKQQEELNETISYIESKINQINLDEKNKRVLGLPLSLLNYLECPNCKGLLILSQGTIDNNMIVKGKLSCQCNYRIIIEKGIIVDTPAIKEKLLPTKKQYYENTSSKFINFMYSSISTLINIINSNNWKNKFVVELGNCCGFFLLQYLPYLSKESIYVLIDNDYKRLSNLKNNLELHYNHENFIFLCCDTDKLPLKEQSVDLVIDSFATVLHRERGWKLIQDAILPLMTYEAHIGGIYPYFSKKTLLENPDINEIYNKNLIADMLTGHFETLETLENGPISEGGLYNPYVDGNEYYNYIYLGKRKV